MLADLQDWYPSLRESNADNVCEQHPLLSKGRDDDGQNSTGIPRRISRQGAKPVTPSLIWSYPWQTAPAAPTANLTIDFNHWLPDSWAHTTSARPPARCPPTLLDWDYCKHWRRSEMARGMHERWICCGHRPSTRWGAGGLSLWPPLYTASRSCWSAPLGENLQIPLLVFIGSSVLLDILQKCGERQF